MESLSAYARQFLQLMDKPDVDVIEGLSPAISIEQKATSHNPRSTVGTVTEIHDYLRLLFARAGTPYCPIHDLPLQSQTVSQMVDAVLALPPETRLMVLAPVARDRKGEFVDVFAEMQARGYVRFRVDGQAYEFDALPKLKKTEKHDIDVVIDRLKVRPDVQQRLAESFEAALRLADGRAIAVEMDSATPEARRRASTGSTPSSPARSATIPSANSSRACSRSTRRWAPARPATAWATWSSSTRRAWWRFPSLSLASGAIKGWDRRNGYYFALIESLAKHYQFSVDAPFEELPQAGARRHPARLGRGGHPLQLHAWNRAAPPAAR